MKRATDAERDSFEHQVAYIKEDMLRDIRSVGKELALDIVALNKKIETKTSIQADKVKVIEANYERFDKRT